MDNYITLRRWIDAIDKLMAQVGSLMLFIMMLVVVADVAFRYALNAPFSWSYEVVSTFLLPGLFFLSVSHTLGANAHVAVDIAHNYVSNKVRYVFEAISNAVATPVFAFITWVAVVQTFNEIVQGTSQTSGLELPSWTASVLLPIGFGLLTLRCALNTLGYIASARTTQTWIELPAISGVEGAAE